MYNKLQNQDLASRRYTKTDKFKKSDVQLINLNSSMNSKAFIRKASKIFTYNPNNQEGKTCREKSFKNNPSGKSILQKIDNKNLLNLDKTKTFKGVKFSDFINK